MSTTFPSLLPKLTDPLWFDVDKAFEDEQALASEEREHQSWVNIKEQIMKYQTNSSPIYACRSNSTSLKERYMSTLSLALHTNWPNCLHYFLLSENV